MRPAIKWGVILGVVICVWTLILHFTGLYTTNIGAGKIADILATAFPIVAVTRAMSERRLMLRRGLRMSESIGTGVLTGLVSVPITAGFLWWYHHFLNPRWMDYLIEYDQAKLTASGASPELIAMAKDAVISSGTDGAQIVAALIGTTVLSLLISLVAGAFLRKAPPNAPSPTPSI